jgi:hypothetical protein
MGEAEVDAAPPVGCGAPDVAPAPFEAFGDGIREKTGDEGREATPARSAKAVPRRPRMKTREIGRLARRCERAARLAVLHCVRPARKRCASASERWSLG